MKKPGHPSCFSGGALLSSEASFSGSLWPFHCDTGFPLWLLQSTNPDLHFTELVSSPNCQATGITEVCGVGV